MAFAFDPASVALLMVETFRLRDMLFEPYIEESLVAITALVQLE